VLAAGWGLPRAPLADYQHRLLAAPGDRHHAFVAYLGDEPVGGANYVAFERTGYLLGAVVRPEARGRGVYRALIAARARHAAAQGIVALTVQAMAHTSAPILDRLGFVDLLELPVYLSR
jgi:GNAT superfamily N-acetyltransferase